MCFSPHHDSMMPASYMIEPGQVVYPFSRLPLVPDMKKLITPVHRYINKQRKRNIYAGNGEKMVSR